MNRIDPGRAVLDATRSVTDVDIEPIVADSPVAVVDCSRGGGGAGWRRICKGVRVRLRIARDRFMVVEPPSCLPQVTAKIDNSTY